MRQFDADLPIILLAETSSEDLAIAAIKAGVTDYFKVPFDAVDLAASVHDLVQAAPATSSPPADPAPAIVGSSRLMRDLRQYIEKIAATDTSVLITGETGTGKDLVAQALHQHGPRRRKPFVSINCAAIPDTLLEAELFGFEAGAFTDARGAKAGLFEAASGGTLLLDEVDALPLALQGKLLTAI